VEFKSGGTYQYYDVPRSVYDEMMKASSIGSFFATRIKSNYRSDPV
jgi:hypothetical protein